MGILKTLTTYGSKAIGFVMPIIRQKSPVILTGMCILGAASASYASYKCAPKYKAELKKAVDEGKSKDGTEKTLPRTTKAQIFLKTMWPAMVALLVVSGSAIGAQKINDKRIAALTTACSIATQKATEAAEKKAEEFIKENLSPEKAEEYKKEREAEHEEVKRVEKAIAAYGPLNTVYDTGAGNQLFVNTDVGVLLRGSYAFIEACVEAFNNSSMANAGYGEQNFMPYNELMAQILGSDYEPDMHKIGNVVGYDADELCSRKRLMANFSSDSIRMPNGEAAVPFGMNIRPKGKNECVIV